MIYKIIIWMSLFIVQMLSGSEAPAQSQQYVPLPTKLSLCQILSDPSKYADVGGNDAGHSDRLREEQQLLRKIEDMLGSK